MNCNVMVEQALLLLFTWIALCSSCMTKVCAIALGGGVEKRVSKGGDRLSGQDGASIVFCLFHLTLVEDPQIIQMPR